MAALHPYVLRSGNSFKGARLRGETGGGGQVSFPPSALCRRGLSSSQHWGVRRGPAASGRSGGGGDGAVVELYGVAALSRRLHQSLYIGALAFPGGARCTTQYGRVVLGPALGLRRMALLRFSAMRSPLS